jgi:hypothetical protein
MSYLFWQYHLLHRQILVQRYFFNCNLELFWENYKKIISTGQIFLSNCDLSTFFK